MDRAARRRDLALGGGARAETLLGYLPSPLVLLAVGLMAILTAFAAARGLTDTDYFWHLETGRLIVERAALPATDPFSFTYGGDWVLHEWLGQAIVYGLVITVGETATAAIFGVLSGLPFVIVALALRGRGVRMPALVVAAGLGVWVTLAYALLRPQVLSWSFLALLLALLLALRADQRWPLLLAVPLFAVWANVHGLYVVGLGVLGFYAVLTLFGATPLRTARHLPWLALAAGFAASALTPSGPAGLLYPLRYVDAGDWGLAHISEWQSPDFHAVGSLGLLALILAVVALGRRDVPGWLTAMAVLGVVMALWAVRNGPLAAILAMPAIAIAVDRLLPSRDAERFSARDRLGRRVIETGLTVVIVVGSVLAVPRLAGGSIGQVPDYFPVEGTDQLERLDPDARVLAEYSWGGYLIHRLYADGGRVFVDGRNDMYGDAILNDYTAAVTAEPGWEAILRRYGVQAILMPPDKALVRGPAQSEGWCEAYRDERQVLLLRRCPDG